MLLGGQTVRVDLAPRWMVRENTYRYRTLRHEGGVELDRLLAEIHDGSVRRATMRDATINELEALIPRLDGVSRRQALAAKRAVHNAAKTLPTLGSELCGVAPLTYAWWRHTQQLAAAAIAVDELEGRDLTSERAVLSTWAGDERVQQSVAMTSTVLLHALRGSARGGDPDKRGRKSEPALVQYFSRSTLRVSPFSRYTAVDVRVLGDRPSADAPGLRSTVAVKRLLTRHAVRRAMSDPANVDHVVWSAPPGAELVGGALVFRRRSWGTPGPGARLDAFREVDVSWPVPEAWQSAVAALLVAPPGSLRDLADRITSEATHRSDAVHAGLVQFASRGLLVPVAPVSEQHPDFEVALLEALRAWPGDGAQDLVAALRSTHQLTAGFGELGGAERTARLDSLEHVWSTAVGAAVTAPIVEDSYVSTSASVPSPVGWRGPIRTLAPLLTALDDQRLLSTALEATFVAEYGVGGVCTDIRRFATKTAGAFPLAQRLLSGDVDSAPSPAVRRLLEARATAVQHLNELSRIDATEVEVEQSVLDTLARTLPDAELARRRTVAVFGQVADDRFVINHLYGGRLRYFSRYLRHLDPAHTEALRSHLRSQTDGALTVQLRPTLGFNANLSPLLTDAELVLDDDVPHSPDTRRVDDLAIVHGPMGLSVIERVSGRAVEMVYTGFLVPHALPATEMLLAMIAEAPFYGFGDVSMDLHRRGPTARAPRIVHEDLVLFRRRWALDPTTLPKGADESSAEHFRRLDADRRAARMPSQVFLRALRGGHTTPMERAMSPKPQHHDFLSRLHASTIRRRLADLGPMVMAEELLPEPTAGAAASETFFEATITGDRP